MRDRILNALAEVVWRWPVALVTIAVLLSAASLWYASQTMRLNANTDDLIAADRPFMKEYRAFLAEFGDQEYIFAVVENSGDAARTEMVVDELTARLRGIEELPGVFSQITPDERLRIATRAMP